MNFLQIKNKLGLVADIDFRPDTDQDGNPTDWFVGWGHGRLILSFHKDNLEHIANGGDCKLVNRTPVFYANGDQINRVRIEPDESEVEEGTVRL